MDGASGEGVDGYKFGNGVPIISLFDDHPDADIIYTDLRVQQNQSIRLSAEFPDLPASQFFDALAIFNQLTPMDDACQ